MAVFKCKMCGGTLEIEENQTEVVIPDGVTEIPNYAFFDCFSLESVTIPNSVTSIGAYAFSGCDSLTSVEVDIKNKNYKSIDGNLYSKDGKTLIKYAIGKTAKTFTIPKRVKSIGKEAFRFCSALESITIPNSVTSIGDYAFCNCNSLTSVEVDIKNKNYKSIDGNLYSNDGKTLIQYAIGKTAKTFTIPNSVISIGDKAFSGCESLTNITIPKSVTSIGDWAFSDCNSLTYNVKNGIKYLGNSSNPYLYLADADANITTASIDSNCRFIGGGAFYSCDSLTSVTIPNSVTSIGDWAFSDCFSLESVTIPNSVTSIGNYVFYNCYSLTNITFNDTITWYRTTSKDEFYGKTGGAKTTVTNSSINATYFRSTYVDYYWYKK